MSTSDPMRIGSRRGGCRLALAAVVLGVASLAAAPGHAQQQLTIAAQSEPNYKGEDQPIITFRADIPPSTTSGIIEYGPADSAEPLLTRPVFLRIGHGSSFADVFVPGRYGVAYRGRMTIQTPQGAIASNEVTIVPQPRFLRPAPYLKYQEVRRRGSPRISALQDVRIVGARGWRAWNCRSSAALSIRRCRLILRSIRTDDPVRLLARHDSAKRQLRIVLTKEGDESMRMKLTVRRSGLGTAPGCELLVHSWGRSFPRDCPSISFASSNGGKLRTVVVHAMRFSKPTIGLTCTGPGCRMAYEEHQRPSGVHLFRFSGYEDLGTGAKLRVSIRARGSYGASREVTITGGGLEISDYQCLNIGSMTEVIPCG